MNKINDLIDLDWWIDYCLDKNTKIRKSIDWRDGNKVVYNVGKLYIRPESIEYKDECYEMAEGLFQKFEESLPLYGEKFYDETEIDFL